MSFHSDVEFVEDGVADARKKQIRNTCIAAFSNLSTAYNLVNVNITHVLMQNQYCGGDNCKSAVALSSTACLAGAIIGQLTFGYVGDCLGRGRALQLTMYLSILGALVSAFAVPITSEPSSVFTFLSISRLFLGIGVGGVYPLAATIAAEGSDDTNRGRTVSLVFSMQGIGTLMVPIVSMIFLYGLGTHEDRVEDNSPYPGIAWRLILGAGAIPGILLMPFKTRSSAPTAAAGSAPSATAGLTLFQALGMSQYWKSIIGCAGGWFLFDITFYGNTIFASTILQYVFGTTNSKGVTPVIGHTFQHNLPLQLMVLALIGLPGYYVSVCFMDKLGRKNIQLQGFTFMAVLYATLAMFLTQMQEGNPAILMTIYGLTYFFSNFGPNSTTFILPSESFPYEVRTSLNGFCAAMGKLGATVGAAAFKPVSNSAGPETAFWLCTGCAGVGILVTSLCIEDRRGRGMRGTSFIANQEQGPCETSMNKP